MTTAERLTAVAENVAKVYESGKTAGATSEYDSFWNRYQDNGNRTQYAAAFGGLGWTAENLKPKYDVICVGNCAQMFYSSGFKGDLAKHFEDSGITLDLSGATSTHSLFNTADKITRIGVINITASGNANSALFAYCQSLVTIDKLVVNATNTFVSWFQSCTALENLTVEGTIGQTGLTLQYSTKLSKASIASVINALSDSTSGLSVTLSKTAVSTAFETSAGAADGSTSEEWAALVATKPNWTVNLV